MKKIIYLVISLLVVYLILCLFGKSQFKVERSITVNAPVDVVKASIVNHKIFHEKWSPWTEKDPGMKVTYEGSEGEAGHKMSWVSDKKEVGKGSMTLNSADGDSIIQTLHFDDYGDSKIYHRVIEEKGAAKVTWGMQSETPFLMRGMMMFMNMEKMIAPDFEKGLTKLKAFNESLSTDTKSPSYYKVNEIEWPGTNFIGSKREFVAIADMPAFFGKHFPEIGNAIQKEKIKSLTAPMALYFSFDEKTMKGDMAAVFNVTLGAKIKGFENYTFPPSKVLHVAYYGNYDKIGDAHAAIVSFLREKAIGQSAVFEEYVTDPMSEKDTTKWLTNIYYVLPGTR